MHYLPEKTRKELNLVAYQMVPIYAMATFWIDFTYMIVHCLFLMTPINTSKATHNQRR